MGTHRGRADHAGHFPWVVLVINVSGSALLAAVPLLPVARRVPWVAVFLGTGILGGYTTMSAASVDTFTVAGRGASWGWHWPTASAPSPRRSPRCCWSSGGAIPRTRLLRGARRG